MHIRTLVPRPLNAFQTAALALLLCLAFVASRLPAAQTGVFIDDRIEDFAAGDLTTSTLTNDGRITLPLSRIVISGIDADVVWDVIEDGDRRYVATGHKGLLFEQRKAEPAKVLHEFKEPAIYALESWKSDDILAAASPGGVIYRVDRKGKAEEFAKTGAAIVWDLLRTKEMGLLAATGSPAAIVKMDDKGTTSTLAKFPDSQNVLSMALLPGGKDIVVATQGPGLVARIGFDGTVHVLLDPEQEEVRRVIVLKDGGIIAAINGLRSPGEKILVKTPTDAKPKPGPKPRPDSFLVRIDGEGLASEWWTSPESPIHDIYAHTDGTIIVAAGSNGNIFRVTPTGDTERAGIADEEFITRLAPADKDRVLLGTGSAAALYELDADKKTDGIFESRAFDAKGNARWSRLRGRVDPAGGSIQLAARSGNTAKPDKTWSDWSKPVDFNSGESLINTSIGRFLQYRLLLQPSAKKNDGIPSVDFVRVFYAKPNARPIVRNVTVEPPKEKPRDPAQPPAQPTGKVDVLPSPNPQTFDVAWQAEDQDGDRLVFDIFIRDVYTGDWIRAAENVPGPKYALEVKTLPDGEYRLKVVAKDYPANSDGFDLTGESESPIFLVDNTAPTLTVTSVKREAKGAFRISVSAQDATSLISGVAWRAGLEDFRQAAPDDQFLDQKSENFTIIVRGEAAQKGTVVTIAATDERGNTSLQKVTLD